MSGNLSIEMLMENLIYLSLLKTLMWWSNWLRKDHRNNQALLAKKTALVLKIFSARPQIRWNVSPKKLKMQKLMIQSWCSPRNTYAPSLLLSVWYLLSKASTRTFAYKNTLMRRKITPRTSSSILLPLHSRITTTKQHQQTSTSREPDIMLLKDS